MFLVNIWFDIFNQVDHIHINTRLIPLFLRLEPLINYTWEIRGPVYIDVSMGQFRALLDFNNP